MAAPVAASLQSTNAVNTASVAVPNINWTPGVPYILLVAAYNEHTGTAAATVSSVTSAGATWVLRKRSNSSATGGLELWWASRTGALSSYTITVNFTGVYDDCTIIIFGVTGCATPATPFDGNVVLPAAQSAPTATWTPVFTGISTSSTDDLLLFVNGSVGGNATAASGFTEIGRNSTGGGSWGSNCKVDGRAVTALQSAATFTHGSTLTSPFGSVTGESIFDALAGNAPAGGGASTQARAMVLA